MYDPEQPTNNRVFSLKPILLTIVLYASIVGLIEFADYKSPAGPCVPGLGFFVELPALFLPPILLIISLIKVVNGRRSQTIPAIIHGLLVLGILIMMMHG